MTVTKQQIMEVLENVELPDGRNVVSAKMVSEIFIDDTKVIFSLNVPSDQAKAMEPVREKVEQTVLAIAGVEKAMVALTAERKPSGNAPEPQLDGGGTKPVQAQPGHRHAPGAADKLPPRKSVPGIKKIIAVASGKGGVGKSTTSVNLALALAEDGLRVGIMDADIYGPSMSQLLAIQGKPVAKDDKTLIPMEAYGLKVMSMSFLVGADTPVIWRGPMVITALTQMLRDVDWGELDVLVVDMPPGTGDAQLTMAQQVPLAGAVIVSTPQDLALIDARKGMNMFKKVDVPLLGVVENMSTFVCPKCGEESNIFGHGGAREEAEKHGVPFLGEIPLHMDIRKNSDAGTPVMKSDANGPHAESYRDIAARVAIALEAQDQV